MNRVKTLLALFALMAVGAFAQQYASESDFQVTKVGNSISIDKYIGKGGAVNIPPTIQGLPIAQLADKAFQNNTAITAVTIPPGVAINNSTFGGCTNLVSVTFQGGDPLHAPMHSAFPGGTDLREKYQAGGAGTYTRQANGTKWTKQGVATQTPASQYASESDFQVTKVGNSISIDKYVGKGGAVNIPPTIQGLPIAQLAGRAFQNNTAITAVTIPPGVAINNSTFGGCTNLVSVTFLGGDPLAAPMADAFPGGSDLRRKYQAGGAGTYTRQANGTTWTKK